MFHIAIILVSLSIPINAHIRRQIPHPESSEIQFIDPTGNFGDVLAGYCAKRRMGLPMGKLVFATNSNGVLARFWRSGCYEQIESTPETTSPAPDWKPADGGVQGLQATLSPAMDILSSCRVTLSASSGISRMSHPVQLPTARGGPLLEPRSTVE